MVYKHAFFIKTKFAFNFSAQKNTVFIANRNWRWISAVNFILLFRMDGVCRIKSMAHERNTSQWRVHEKRKETIALGHQGWQALEMEIMHNEKDPISAPEGTEKNHFKVTKIVNSWLRQHCSYCHSNLLNWFNQSYDQLKKQC